MADKLDYETPQTLPQPLSIAMGAPETLRLLTEYSGATCTILSRDLRFLYVNACFASWVGLPPEQLIGVPIHDVYGEHNSIRYMPYLERAFAGETVRYERQVRSPAGVEEWRTICLAPCRNDQGEVFAIIHVALDVHELRVAHEAVRAAKQRLSSHMENSPLAVIETDSALRIVYCSARTEELLGWQPASVQGRSLLELPALSDAKPLTEALDRLRSGTETRNRAEATHSRGNGSLIHCEWFNSALTNAEGELVSVMALVEDVSGRVLAAQQLQHLAERDPLTGLLNRSAFRSRLSLSLERARAAGGLVTLLFIDLDGFKGVNDGFGHATGDAVLCEVARRLTSVVRATDTVARLGGDEFTVMLDADIDASTAESMSRRIFNVLDLPFDIGPMRLPVGASIGVAACPPLTGLADDLIRAADQAMYEAKRAGKGCLRYAFAA